MGHGTVATVDAAVHHDNRVALTNGGVGTEDRVAGEQAVAEDQCAAVVLQGHSVIERQVREEGGLPRAQVLHLRLIHGHLFRWSDDRQRLSIDREAREVVGIGWRHADQDRVSIRSSVHSGLDGREVCSALHGNGPDLSTGRGGHEGKRSGKQDPIHE